MTRQTLAPLKREAMAADPLVEFDRWFELAVKHADYAMPEAACLSTVDDEGYPEGRIVLLKARDVEGFVFYTNLRSAKGRALTFRPRAALTFYWESLMRQVRIQGDVEHVSDEVSDAYFGSRARESQIGAWASPQSTVLGSRDELLASVAEVKKRYRGADVPRPAHWGGLRILPREIEFWQGMPNRLHDRFVYRRGGLNEEWTLERLAP